jgi:hypothetical protein
MSRHLQKKFLGILRQIVESASDSFSFVAVGSSAMSYVYFRNDVTYNKQGR